MNKNLLYVFLFSFTLFTTQALASTEDLRVLVEEGNYSALKKAIAAGADVNYTAQDVDMDEFSHVSPLYIAAAYNKLDMVELLLKNGAKQEVFEKEGITPFMMACYEGNSKAIQLYLRYGADVNYVDGHGNSALTSAVMGNHLDVVKLLIEKGAPVNDKDIEAVTTSPLHEAVKNNTLYMKRLLKESGEHMKIIQKANNAIVDLLLQRGASTQKLDWQKKRPVDYAQNATLKKKLSK